VKQTSWRDPVHARSYRTFGPCRWLAARASMDPHGGDRGRKVTVMSWVILVILAVLAVLILAGPPVERIIDRLWPPGGVRPPHHPNRPPERR
jgi:hypothetical protein